MLTHSLLLSYLLTFWFWKTIRLSIRIQSFGIRIIKICPNSFYFSAIPTVAEPYCNQYCLDKSKSNSSLWFDWCLSILRWILTQNLFWAISNQSDFCAKLFEKIVHWFLGKWIYWWNIQSDQTCKKDCVYFECKATYSVLRLSSQFRQELLF